jgi:hypothetical protein
MPGVTLRKNDDTPLIELIGLQITLLQKVINYHVLITFQKVINYQLLFILLLYLNHAYRFQPFHNTKSSKIISCKIGGKFKNT